MAKKFLYGNLNQDVVMPKYSGDETDSLKINIDNNAMKISGEVIWDAFIGEVANKAYPGNKGAQTRKDLDGLAQRVAAEAQKSETYQRTVDSTLNYITNEIEDVSACVDDINKTVKSNNTSIASQQKHIDYLDSAFDNHSVTIANINKQINSLMNGSEHDVAVDQQLNELTNQLEDISNTQQKTAESHGKRLTTVEQTTYSTLQQIKDLQAKTINLETSSATTEQQVSELKVDLSIETATREQDVNTLGASIQTLENKQNAQKQQLEALNQQVDKSLQELSTVSLELTTGVAELMQRTVELRKTDKITQSSIDDLTVQIAKVQSHSKSLEQYLNNQLRALIEANSKLTEVDSELKEKLSKQENQLKELWVTINYLQSVTVKNILDELSGQKQDTIDLYKSVEQLQQYSINFESLILLNTNAIRELDSKCTAELSTQKNTLLQHDKLIGRIEDDIQELRDEYVDLTNSFRSVETAVNGVTEQTTAQYNNVVDKLNEETRRAVESENSLKSDIEHNALSITQLHQHVARAFEVHVTDLDAADAKLRDEIENEEAARVNADKELQKQLEKIVDDVKNQIESIQFDFIDGGKAPIKK